MTQNHNDDADLKKTSSAGEEAPPKKQPLLLVILCLLFIGGGYLGYVHFTQWRIHKLEEEYTETMGPFWVFRGEVSLSEADDDNEPLSAERIAGMTFKGDWPGADGAGDDLKDEDLESLIPYFNALPNLRRLEIRGSKITDDGFVHLTKLDYIEHLELQGPLTGEGLAHLKDMPSLKILCLEETFSDTGLEYLQDISKLEALTLKRTDVTDEGIALVAAVSSLRSLSLLDANITDDGLTHLAELSQLEELSLKRTNVSEAAIEELQNALPNCTIARP